MKKNVIVYLLSIILIIFVFIVTRFLLSDWYEKANKNLEQNEKQLLEVVELVKNDGLEQDYDKLYKIPDEYKVLTKDGLIVVYQNDEEGIQVGFYSFRGMQTGSCYLMYSSGGEEMIRDNESGHPILEIAYLKDNWYYVETDY